MKDGMKTLVCEDEAIIDQVHGFIFSRVVDQISNLQDLQTVTYRYNRRVPIIPPPSVNNDYYHEDVYNLDKLTERLIIWKASMGPGTVPVLLVYRFVKARKAFRIEYNMSLSLPDLACYYSTNSFFKMSVAFYCKIYNRGSNEMFYNIYNFNDSRLVHRINFPKDEPCNVDGSIWFMPNFENGIFQNHCHQNESLVVSFYRKMENMGTNKIDIIVTSRTTLRMKHHTVLASAMSNGDLISFDNSTSYRKHTSCIKFHHFYLRGDIIGVNSYFLPVAYSPGGLKLSIHPTDLTLSVQFIYTDHPKLDVKVYRLDCLPRQGLMKNLPFVSLHKIRIRGPLPSSNFPVELHNVEFTKYRLLYISYRMIPKTSRNYLESINFLAPSIQY
jgi:hypothetical protein